MAKTAAPTGPKAAPKKEKAPERKVVHEDVDAFIRMGEEALTVQEAKDLLGWTPDESGEEDKFGDDYMMTDYNKTKIQCKNNLKNRPFDVGWCERLSQDILRGRWRFNGESIIIGKYGSVLSGQHRLIGLILAEQERTSEKRGHVWQDKWPDELKMECVLVQGVDESKETTRTIDNVKPRSLSDVLFADEATFGKAGTKDRKVLCRMADTCVRTLWERTGAAKDAWAPLRTHSEAIDFIDRHKHVLECVSHIYDEDKATHSVGQFITPGMAAGLLYLMGCSTSDEQDYKDRNQVGSEKKLSWDNFDKAKEFWTLLAGEESSTGNLREALAALVDPVEGVTAKTHEKCATICKAWKAFLKGQLDEVTSEDLRPEMVYDDKHHRHLIECVDVGGIDHGNKTSQPKEDDEEDTPPQSIDDLPPVEQPSEEEVEAVESARNAIKEEKITRIKERKLKPKVDADSWEVGFTHYPEGEVNKCEGPFPTEKEAQDAADSLNFELEVAEEAYPRWVVAPVGEFTKVGAAKTETVKKKPIVRKT